MSDRQVCPHVMPSHDSKHVTREQAIELLEALQEAIEEPACREGLRRIALFVAEQSSPRGVREIGPEALVRRALMNARPRGQADRPLWGCVTNAFGLGSTYAEELCRNFGFDPDATVRADRCEACAELAESEGRARGGGPT